MSYCKKCGHELNGDENVCPNCGNTVKEDTKAAVDPEIVDEKKSENKNNNMSYNYETDYFGLDKVLSAILAIFIGSILGGIARIMEGKAVAGVIRILLAFIGVGFVINIIDCIMIATTGKMLRVIEQ